jgi:hypothetical protein
MLYDSFEYLWPPRPEQAIDRRLLGMMEKRGFVAQVKKNGTCSVIFVSPDKKITAMNRYKETHRQWTPTDVGMAAFRDLPGKGWYVFVAELMHNKVPGIRDVNYVHDILVHDGEYLAGVSQADRQANLRALFLRGDEDRTHSHSIVNPHLWIPVEYRTGFSKLFNSLTAIEDEGIVLKDPRRPLALCSRASSNATNMYKCRRPHKNYSF